MHKSVKFLLILLCSCGLLLVRFYESQLFYDPLISFFKGEFYNTQLPELSLGSLILSTTGRYLINSILSLCILYLVFKSKDVLRVSAYIFLGLFVLLIAVFASLIAADSQALTLLFYIRRFLIQPLLLLLLLPAFYYHKINK